MTRNANSEFHLFNYCLVVYQSPAGKSFMHCCKYFGLCSRVPDFGLNIAFLTPLKSLTDASRFLTASTEIIQLLLELIMIRDGILNLYHPYTSLPKSFLTLIK
jgi:hypothetical protein